MQIYVSLYDDFGKYQVFYVRGKIILQLIRDFQQDFQRNLQHSVQMLDVKKRNLNVCFKFANASHA